MITGALFSGYALGVGAIVYNITRTKMQDDFENEIRKLREYDFGHETINSEKDLPINCIMLAKYVPEDNQHIPSKEPKIKVGLDEKAPVQNDLIFSRVLSYSVLLDPTKFVEVRSSIMQESGLTIFEFSIYLEKGMALR
jgi:hypothetical protein